METYTSKKIDHITKTVTIGLNKAPAKGIAGFVSRL
jgi:hypothetical protein